MIFLRPLRMKQFLVLAPAQDRFSEEETKKWVVHLKMTPKTDLDIDKCTPQMSDPDILITKLIHPEQQQDQVAWHVQHGTVHQESPEAMSENLPDPRICVGPKAHMLSKDPSAVFHRGLHIAAQGP